MVAEPVVTPVTTPVPVPTVATLALLLVHVPPLAASASVVVCPWQMVEPTPVIGANTFTVIV